jgi:hypothetical protein
MRNRRTRLRRGGLATLAAAAAVSLGVTAAAVGQSNTETRTGNDPLGASELNSALQVLRSGAAGSPFAADAQTAVVRQDQRATRAAAGQRPADIARAQLEERRSARPGAAAAAAVPAPAPELLKVEREAPVKGARADAARQARVDVYRYETDTLVTLLVDPATGRVVSTTTSTGVQLPLSANEQATAVLMALEDPVVGARITAEYRRVTGRTLTDPDTQLIVAPLVFLADSMPSRSLGSASACGAQRCAQLLLSTSDNTLMEIMPIVNLSRGTVLDTQPFFGGN